MGEVRYIADTYQRRSFVYREPIKSDLKFNGHTEEELKDIQEHILQQIHHFMEHHAVMKVARESDFGEISYTIEVFFQEKDE